MTRTDRTPLPAKPHALLLVEGGDESNLCRAIAGPAWAGMHCWNVKGRDRLPLEAEAARLDPNYGFVRSVGIVMDIEDSLPRAVEIAKATLEALASPGAPTHGVVAHGRGVFFLPDGSNPGALESLCRRAVRDPARAQCADALLKCAGAGHQTTAAVDKAWLRAYLATLPDPTLRFYQVLDHPLGIDPSSPAFDPLREFLANL